MPEEFKTKYVIASAIKKEAIPEEVLKSAKEDEADMWVYASVEAPDRDGDIVRVKGIDTDEFTKSGGAIKFLVAHQTKLLPDGNWPVLGKAVRWIPTTHRTTGLPAMVAGVKFAPTPFAQQTKQLYAEGYLTDVSIGFKPKSGKPLEKGGYDITECMVGELSACVIGANQFAGVVKALDAEQNETAPLTLTKDDLLPITEALKALEPLKDVPAIHELCKKLISRLDDLEDSLSSLPKGAAPQDDRNKQQSAKIDLDKLRSLLSKL